MSQKTNTNTNSNATPEVAQQEPVVVVTRLQQAALSNSECKAKLGIAQGPVIYISRANVGVAKRILAIAQKKTGKASFSAGFWTIVKEYLEAHPDGQ